MTHKTKKFTFLNSEGESIEVTTKQYCFEVEDVLKNRFGEYDDLLNQTDIELNISLEDVEADFPKLLELGDNKIIWRKQDYDTLLEVYGFFLLYKRNAIVRLLTSNKEMLASEVEKAKAILRSMPELISQSMNTLNLGNTSSQEKTRQN